MMTYDSIPSCKLSKNATAEIDHKMRRDDVSLKILNDFRSRILIIHVMGIPSNVKVTVSTRFKTVLNVPPLRD